MIVNSQLKRDSFQNKTVVYSFSNYCAVQDEFKLLNSYYQVLLFSLFFASLLLICVFYIRVYRHIYKVSCHQRFETIGRKNSRSSTAPLTQLNHARSSVSSISDNKGFFNNFIEKFCKTDSIVNSKLIKKNCEFIPVTNLNNIEEIDFETETNEKMNVPCKKEDSDFNIINENFSKEENINIGNFFL